MTKLEFEQAVYKLFNEYKKILAFVRIPNAGGNRHFFFINNRSDFDSLMKESNPSDSITIFKSMNLLFSGQITERFIEDVLLGISKDSFESELVILSDSYKEFKEKGYSEWFGLEKIEELEEILREKIGEYVSILADPDFCDEKNIWHLYFPDKYGICKPGNAY